jgi:hypothetical protein
LTQREAAAKIGGVSGGAVSRQMRKVRLLLENDHDLRCLVERAEGMIGKLRQSMSKLQRTDTSK